jgi:hypothetical protein
MIEEVLCTLGKLIFILLYSNILITNIEVTVIHIKRTERWFSRLHLSLKIEAALRESAI